MYSAGNLITMREAIWSRVGSRQVYVVRRVVIARVWVKEFLRGVMHLFLQFHVIRVNGSGRARICLETADDNDRPRFYK